MKQFTKNVIFLIVFCIPIAGCSQQQADLDFIPKVDSPLFEQGIGPLMLVDNGHNNFHTLEDKFAPFGKVAVTDGFKVRSISGDINKPALKDAGILVVANALNEKNVDSWQKPVYTAFSQQEIKQIRDWVSNGGRLFLIADHMPFSGAVTDLAELFGFTFYDGFALRKPKTRSDIFSFGSGTLRHNIITDLHGSIDSIVTFTGQAFEIPSEATSIITLDSNYQLLMPEVAWEFNADTRKIPANGLSQLAYRYYGKGKVVIAGEAAMFTAQKAGGMQIGINSAFAKSNLQLLLNIFEWLGSD